jgi:hypothetical protein
MGRKRLVLREARFGAVPHGDGLTDVRVWAPFAGSVAVRTKHEMTLERAGESLDWRNFTRLG